MSTENMNTPTEKQIQEVLAGTSTPEVARIVAAWFATDEGASYLAKSMDRDAVQIKQGFEELYVNHEIPSEEIFAVSAATSGRNASAGLPSVWQPYSFRLCC